MSGGSCDILVTAELHQRIMEHLFPGDRDEYGAILRAGIVRNGSSLRLLVQHVQSAEFGTDYVAGRYGYRALTPTFIHREILRCRDAGLAYLAVHNHGSDRHVEFSQVDLESHERGYPALLDIGRGVPVGALVYGWRSVAADIWLPDGSRRTLGSYRVIGHEITRLYSQPRRNGESNTEHDRQVRMFGAAGQHVLRASKVAVIGLGGVGSLVAEYLARLGIGNLVLIDPDEIESSNLSRVVGATRVDVEAGQLKTQIAVRHAREMAIDATLKPIAGDVARESVARVLRDCDFIFLAADSMRARLVVNALAHQYLIPCSTDGRESTTGRWWQNRRRHVCGAAYQAGHGLPVVQRPDRSDAACDGGEVRQRTQGTGLRRAGAQPQRDYLERCGCRPCGQRFPVRFPGGYEAETWKQSTTTSISIAARHNAFCRVATPNAGNASTGWVWATR